MNLKDNLALFVLFLVSPALLVVGIAMIRSSRRASSWDTPARDREHKRAMKAKAQKERENAPPGRY